MWWKHTDFWHSTEVLKAEHDYYRRLAKISNFRNFWIKARVGLDDIVKNVYHNVSKFMSLKP